MQNLTGVLTRRGNLGTGRERIVCAPRSIYFRTQQEGGHLASSHGEKASEETKHTDTLTVDFLPPEL